MRKKRADLEALVIALLKEQKEISVPDVAQAAGMSKSDEGDRKAIRRVLTALVERGFLEARGTARARVYGACTSTLAEVQKSQVDLKPFKDIPLSLESQRLLKYVSQSLQARGPVGYNQDFLHSYLPNQSFYLTHTQRVELLKIGTAESIERPVGTYARNILNRLLIDLSWNSSCLEGNTYAVILGKVPGPQVVQRIQSLIEMIKFPDADAAELFKLIIPRPEDVPGAHPWRLLKVTRRRKIMQSIKTVEVNLYLYEAWAKALAEFSVEVLEGKSLPLELKGAIIELREALYDEGFK